MGIEDLKLRDWREIGGFDGAKLTFIPQNTIKI